MPFSQFSVTISLDYLTAQGMEKKPISVIFVIVIFISFVATGIFAYLYLTEKDISADLEANLQVQTTTLNEQIRLLEIGDDPTMFERDGWRISFQRY